MVTGSAFHFTANFGLGQAPVAAPVRADATVASGPLRILVAEDNAVNQKLALRLLEKMSHRVTLARDGCEALELFEREVPDVILMDVQMPRMDGYEATAMIRLMERERGGGHVPIIGVTANALIGDRENCLAAGMDAYLSKPIRRDDLIRALAEATQATDRSKTAG
jgi:CheY-like chemotaxis protein